MVDQVSYIDELTSNSSNKLFMDYSSKKSPYTVTDVPLRGCYKRYRHPSRQDGRRQKWIFRLSQFLVPKRGNRHIEVPFYENIVLNIKKQRYFITFIIIRINHF